MDESEMEQPIFEPDEAKMSCLAATLRTKFQVDLFGVDVIIENTTGRYAVIDINSFPGVCSQRTWLLQTQSTLAQLTMEQMLVMMHMHLKSSFVCMYPSRNHELRRFQYNVAFLQNRLIFFMIVRFTLLSQIEADNGFMTVVDCVFFFKIVRLVGHTHVW